MEKSDRITVIRYDMMT